MAEKFLMPKLSPTMEEGQISRWVKNEGDTYEANETLAEVDHAGVAAMQGKNVAGIEITMGQDGAVAFGWADLGEFPIAGFSMAQRVFGLREELAA